MVKLKPIENGGIPSNFYKEMQIQFLNYTGLKENSVTVIKCDIENSDGVLGYKRGIGSLISANQGSQVRIIEILPDTIVVEDADYEQFDVPFFVLGSPIINHDFSLPINLNSNIEVRLNANKREVIFPGMIEVLTFEEVAELCNNVTELLNKSNRY